MKEKTVIIIAGPTAVGKTAAAIQAALHFNTEIISADSRQCYRELKIGVARPTDEELAACPHHFIASHSVTENLSAVDFENYALEKAAELFRQKDVVVMTGGTGLYIRAFCQGLDSMPSINSSLREELRLRYEEEGLSWLQNEVRTLDPHFFSVGEVQNPHRLLRALEIVKTTGKSILEFKKGSEKERPFRIIRIGLELPRDLLIKRINDRVDQMIEAGLIDEARSVLPFRDLNALNTVGYKEVFSFFDGKVQVDEMIDAIKINTRQYAKRQMTWFRKEHFEWINAESFNVNAIQT